METAAYALGLICGLALLGIFAVALAFAVAPFVRGGDRDFRIAMLVLIGVAIVKLLLLRILPGEPTDLSQFETWGRVMAQLGPAHIYDPEYACKYTPAYLYALWPAAALAPAWPEWPRIFIEGLTVLGDLLFGLTAYAAVRRIAPRRFALPTIIVLALNPTIIYTSTVWGQNDSAIVFPVLLSVLMLADSRYALAWAIAIAGALVKMQGVIVLPLMAWWTLCNGRPADWLKGAGASIVTAIIVFAPFQLGHPWHFVLDVFGSSAGFFPWASVNAFNLMLALGGLVIMDSDKVIGPLSFFMIGNVLFAAALVVAGWIVWRRRTEWALMYAVFLVYLGMFSFLPRMHERYLYYAVALMAPLMFSSWTTIALYVILTTTSLLDMAYVFFNLVTITGVAEGHLLLGPGGRFVIAIVNLAAFVWAAIYGISAAWNAGQRLFDAQETLVESAESSGARIGGG